MDSAANSKTTMTLAEVRYKAMQSHSIPDLGVQGHLVEPLKVDKDLVSWVPKKHSKKNVQIYSSEFGANFFQDLGPSSDELSQPVNEYVSYKFFKSS